MKTRSLVTKAMALLMASAMVMGNTGMVVHASDDGCVRDEVAAGGNDNGASMDIGSSSASYSAPAPKAAGVSASAGKEAFRAIAKAGAGR